MVKIWLQNGWKEFAEHYSLTLESLLIFEYKNNCHFLVLILDKTAMEIDYSFGISTVFLLKNLSTKLVIMTIYIISN